MTNEDVIANIRGIVLTIPAHWPDAPAAKEPQRVLRVESTYIYSKKKYKIKIVFSVGLRTISGEGETMFAAVQNAFVRAVPAYGNGVFSNHECFQK